ncbi:hypothetical protein HK405_007061, partial [Cladochytrium tenue]
MKFQASPAIVAAVNAVVDAHGAVNSRRMREGIPNGQDVCVIMEDPIDEEDAELALQRGIPRDLISLLAVMDGYSGYYMAEMTFYNARAIINTRIQTLQIHREVERAEIARRLQRPEMDAKGGVDVAALEDIPVTDEDLLFKPSYWPMGDDGAGSLFLMDSETGRVGYLPKHGDAIEWQADSLLQWLQKELAL